ncbi:MAG: hypothetical protein AABY22_19435, partial [Nanoarchaeota archaeon]
SKDGGRFFCSDLLPYRKGKIFWVQVKNKEPRKYYPDTGLERWRFDNLKFHQKETGRPVLLLFTDISKKIYGDWIDNLRDDKHPAMENKKDNIEMIYFWLADLKDLNKLFS